MRFNKNKKSYSSYFKFNNKKIFLKKKIEGLISNLESKINELSSFYSNLSLRNYIHRVNIKKKNKNKKRKKRRDSVILKKKSLKKELIKNYFLHRKALQLKIMLNQSHSLFSNQQSRNSFTSFKKPSPKLYLSRTLRKKISNFHLI